MALKNYSIYFILISITTAQHMYVLPKDQGDRRWTLPENVVKYNFNPLTNYSVQNNASMPQEITVNTESSPVPEYNITMNTSPKNIGKIENKTHEEKIKVPQEYKQKFIPLEYGTKLQEFKSNSKLQEYGAKLQEYPSKAEYSKGATENTEKSNTQATYCVTDRKIPNENEDTLKHKLIKLVHESKMDIDKKKQVLSGINNSFKGDKMYQIGYILSLTDKVYEDLQNLHKRIHDNKDNLNSLQLMNAYVKVKNINDFLTESMRYLNSVIKSRDHNIPLTSKKVNNRGISWSYYDDVHGQN